MKILITGFPGTGKSVIAVELKRRGHQAYDPENMRGYEYAVDRKTGERIHPPHPVPTGWYDTVAKQVWDPVKIYPLLVHPNDIFICSYVHELTNYWHFFDLVFVLTLDDVILEQRLSERHGPKLGKDGVELRDIMKLHRDFERSLVERGAIALNAEHGVHELVDTILNTVEA